MSGETYITQWVAAAVERQAEAFTCLGGDILSLAESRFAEPGAMQARTEVLERHGFRITRELGALPSACLAQAGGPGPVLAFLGEHDALLAALVVRDYLASHGLPGTVRYHGCPAEEGGDGKTYLVRAGAFQGCDLALAWHPGPFDGIFTDRSLAVIQAYFRFSGRAAHAAASPHLGRSALDAVELMNVGVNFLREHMPIEARIHYAITDTGGGAPNVVQKNADVLYVVRSPDIAQATPLFERVKDVARGAALMTETELSIEIDRACSNLVRNAVIEEAMRAQLKQLGPPPFDARGELPAAHMGLLHAAKVLAATAIDLSADPARLARARAELRASTAGQAFVWPIPPEVRAPPPRRSEEFS